MSDDNVFFLPVRVHEGQIDPNRVLTAAVNKKLTDVLIIGTEPDGSFYCASSMDAAHAVLHIEKARIEILKSLGPL